MKTALKLNLIALLIFSLFSCKSEREKKIEAINNESKKILSSAITELTLKGYKVNSDSLIDVYTRISSDSAELGLEYAKEIKNSIDQAQKVQEQVKQQTQAVVDTTKYFELKLVKKETFYNSAKLTFELRNLLTHEIEDLDIRASLRDKNDEFLADDLFLTWKNVRSDGVGVASTWWKDIKIEDIGGVILVPHNLTIGGEDYRFDGLNVKIIENKYNIKVVF